MRDLDEIYNLDKQEKQLMELIRMSGLEESSEAQLIEKCKEIRIKRQNIVFSQFKQNLLMKTNNEYLKSTVKEYQESILNQTRNLDEYEISLDNKFDSLETKFRDSEDRSEELFAMSKRAFEIKEDEINQCKISSKFYVIILMSIIVMLLFLRLKM